MKLSTFVSLNSKAKIKIIEPILSNMRSMKITSEYFGQRQSQVHSSISQTTRPLEKDKSTETFSDHNNNQSMLLDSKKGSKKRLQSGNTQKLKFDNRKHSVKSTHVTLN